MAETFDVYRVFRDILEHQYDFTQTDDPSILIESIGKTPKEYLLDLAKEFHFSGILRSFIVGKHYSCASVVLKVNHIFDHLILAYGR